MLPVCYARRSCQVEQQRWRVPRGEDEPHRRRRAEQLDSEQPQADDVLELSRRAAASADAEELAQQRQQQGLLLEQLKRGRSADGVDEPDSRHAATFAALTVIPIQKSSKQHEQQQ